MITTDNIRTINMPDIFGKAAKELTSIQSSIAGRENVKRTGNLSNYLRGQAYHVDSQDGETSLTITYPVYIRFLDMLFRKGKQKKKVSIYNQYVWGFMMGYIYNRTRGGIVRNLAEKLKETKIEI